MLFCRNRAISLDEVEVKRLFESNDGPRAWYLLNFVLWWNQHLAAGSQHLALAGLSSILR